jgi:hypothetical protein
MVMMIMKGVLVAVTVKKKVISLHAFTKACSPYITNVQIYFSTANLFAHEYIVSIFPTSNQMELNSNVRYNFVNGMVNTISALTPRAECIFGAYR